MKTPQSVIDRVKDIASQFSGDSCWEWPRYRNPKSGYGQLSGYVNGGTRQFTAHRASYEAFIGEIPSGMCVCHKCDHGPCFNPAHLFLGTMKDNTHDMIRKGRGGYFKYRPRGDAHWTRARNHLVPRGAKNGNSKLDEALVMKILVSPLNDSALAREMGVTRTTISNIRGGETWRHVSQAASQSLTRSP